MKNEMKEFPVPLLTQILIRIGLAAASLVVGIGLLLLLHDLTAAAPCGLVTLLMVVSAVNIYRITALGRYLILKGTVLKVERAATLGRAQRAKALLLEIEGKAVRVSLRNRNRAPAEGTVVALYASDTAPLYEWRGVHQIFSYLALVADV